MGKNSAGTLTAKTNSESSVTLTLSGLVPVQIKRNINWWYKLSTEPESKWKKYGQTAIASHEGISKSFVINDLIPNRLYNFNATIYESNSQYDNYKKIAEKYVNEKTAMALGSLTFSDLTSRSVTVTVSDLVPVGYFREIKYRYRKKGDSSWTNKAVRTIAPDVSPYRSDVGLPYTFTGLKPETAYEFIADISIMGGDWYRSCGGSVTTPYNGISVPQVFDTGKIVLNGNRCHTVIPPDSWITLTWWVPPANVVDDTIHETKFTLYYQRDGGEEQEVGEWANLRELPMSVYDNGAVTTNDRIWGQAGVDGDDWLGASEDISVWVVAEHNGHKAESARVPISVTRYFYWDAEKIAGEDFGITASEWNRLESYLDDAHELYPDYFNEHSASQVSGGDPVTALIANAAGYRLHHECEVLLDSQLETTALLYSIYQNGFGRAVSDEITELISVTAEVAYGTHSLSGTVEAELTVNSHGVKMVHVLPGQSIFESGLASVHTTVKITVAYDVGEEVQAGEDVTAADANAIESYLHEKMYKATGH